MIWNYNDKGNISHFMRSSNFCSILLAVTTVLIGVLTVSHCVMYDLLLTVVLQTTYNHTVSLKKVILIVQSHRASKRQSLDSS